MNVVLALVLTWIALDIAILVALQRWRYPDPPQPPPDVTVGRIQRNGLIRFKEPKT